MSTMLPVLRRSAVQAAKACLFRYKALWVDGVPDSNDLSLKGIAFHAAAHRYIVRLVEQQLPQDEEEAQLAFKEGIASVLTPAHLVAEVREMFFRWAELFAVDLESFVAAEEHQIGKNQHTFTPDLVYARPNGLEVVDFKTFWHPMTEVQIKNDFQCRWYLYNAARIWPNFPSYSFTHSYVRFGKQVTVSLSPAELLPLEAEVSAIAATIDEAAQRNEWPATPGTECAYCELACPVANHPALLPKRLSVPAQAKVVGGWILTAEQQLKAAKKALKTYCSANGPVNVDGVEWDNRPVESRSYPVGSVIEALNKLKVVRDSAVWGPDAFGLTISHSALAGVIKEYPELERALLPVQATKTTYRFSAKKPGMSDGNDE